MKTAPKKATRIKAGRIQRANYKWIYLFLLPTIVIFAMFYLMPIAQVFVTSFTKWDGFNAPKFNGLTNYINLFTNYNTPGNPGSLRPFEAVVYRK